MPGSESDPEHADKQPLAQTTSSTPLLPEASCQSLQVSAIDGSAAHAEKIKLQNRSHSFSSTGSNGSNESHASTTSTNSQSSLRRLRMIKHGTTCRNYKKTICLPLLLLGIISLPIYFLLLHYYPDKMFDFNLSASRSKPRPNQKHPSGEYQMKQELADQNADSYEYESTRRSKSTDTNTAHPHKAQPAYTDEPGDFSDIMHQLTNLKARPDRANMSGVLYREASKFDFWGNDVIVYLHIQKTGGTTFGRQIVDDLLSRESKSAMCRKQLNNNYDPRVQMERKKFLKRRRCNRTSNLEDEWIFSRLSTGWACGLHADFTELSQCVKPYLEKKLKENPVTKSKFDKLKYYLITTLRDPVDRYISEWQHMRRGATWRNQQLKCKHVKYADTLHSRMCWRLDQYKTMEDRETWKNVTLDAFIKCPFNMAANRQTRMLADLRMSDNSCYYDKIFPIRTSSDPNYDIYKTAMEELLESAKHNLATQITFFTLLEFQRLSQYLFERTFNAQFRTKFEQRQDTVANEMKGDLKTTAENTLSKHEIELIKEANQYDIKLYEFAEDIFFERIKYFTTHDSNVK